MIGYYSPLAKKNKFIFQTIDGRRKIFTRNIKWHLTETGRENKEVLWLPTSVLKSTLKRGEGGVGDGVAI